MNYYLGGCALVILFLFSCQADVEFENFDATAWQTDRHGCLGLRTTLFDALLNEQEKIIGLRQKAVGRALGKPDHQELYMRNQKFYVYFIDPSEACRDQSNREQPRQLHLRFDAIGKVNEISVQY